MLNQLAEKLKSYKDKKIAVISHVRPDADCIGAQVALARWLGRNGITVAAYNDDNIPPFLAWMCEYFPVEKTDLSELARFDAYVFVDGNYPPRFGEAGAFADASGKPMYMIDHHPDPVLKHFEISLSDVSASSTCELIYGLFASDLSQLDRKSAEALYAGIMTDTGSFRFDSVSSRTHRVVADLIDHAQLEPEVVHRRIFDGRSLNQLQLLARVLGTVQLHEGNRFATLTVTRQMIQETQTAYHDLEGFVNYGLSIRGVEVSLLFCELRDSIKISLRSVSDVDVNVWARQLNGGGHVRAAGASHPGPIDQAMRDALAIGAKQLKKA